MLIRETQIMCHQHYTFRKQENQAIGIHVAYCSSSDLFWHLWTCIRTGYVAIGSHGYEEKYATRKLQQSDYIRDIYGESLDLCLLCLELTLFYFSNGLCA